MSKTILMTSAADTRPPVRWWAALAVCAMLVALAAGCPRGDAGGPAAEPSPTPVPTTAAPAAGAPGATISGAGPTAVPTGGAPAAEMAIPFELPNAAGGTVSLDSFLGDRHVVLVFYRTYR
jgi:hypothetical protein